MSSAASVPSSGALISHLVSRIESDLSFLASHNLLTAPELAQIKSSLLEAQTRANGAALELLAVRNGDAQQVGLATQQAANVQPAVTKQQCKAVWDYNKAQPDDLAFRAGDVITIEEEVNADWWRGTLNGQTGLFPCNHVEKLPPTAPSTGMPAPPPREKMASPYNQTPQSSWSSSPAPAYAYQQPQNYGAPHNNEKYQQQQPPPPPPPQQQQQQPAWNGIPSYAQAPPPPPQQQPVVVDQDGGKKKNKFGGLGKTVGTAFAGGIGFGAGTAIANDAINAIF